VGLTEEQLQVSPFDLSGGQKRRVAIAGVIAMEPEVLILDEPTAGLDPKERLRLRNYIADFAKDRIVFITTHIVSDIETVADDVLLMKDGQLLRNGSPRELMESVNGNSLEDVYMAYLGDD
jgi:ABC-type multidrug transport system ATPase subunit